MPDKSNSMRGLMRIVRQVMAPLSCRVTAMVEWASVGSTSAGAGEAPTATTEDDDITVLEGYGLAVAPPGASQTIVLAPGGDSTARVALALSSLSGRPATDAGNVVLWTAAGHSIELDDDGGMLITAKDGQTIDLADTGDVIVTPAPGFKARIGGGGPSQPAAKATITRSEIQTLVTAITAVVPVGADTGALIVAAVTAAFLTGVDDLGSSNVEVLE